jgi:hypothetical protein
MTVNMADPKVKASAIAAGMFVVVTAPLAWRRSAPLAVAAVTALALGGHGLLFGRMVRCAVALPLLFLLAFSSWSRLARRRAVYGLGIVLAGGALMTAWETQFGWATMPMIALICGGSWGIGRLVRSRSAMAATLAQQRAELRARRDERATMEVAVERAQLASRLDQLLHHRLDQLAVMAELGQETADPAAAARLLAEIEVDGRATLDGMREIVGNLGGGGMDSDRPLPSVVGLQALVGAAGQSCLKLEGDPCALPPAVELCAYRIVEHFLSAVRPGGPEDVEVVVRFMDGSIELQLDGPAGTTAQLRRVLDVARERADLHRGSIVARSHRGRLTVSATLPLAAG